MYFEDKVLNDKYVLSTFANGKFKLKINKSSENDDVVNAIDFFDKYAKVGKYYDIFNFDYNMSSGEIALLSLYSRFYSLLKINRIGSYQHKNIDLKGKNILILLDEAEVLFHPEWQQKYINNLLEFFKHIFNGSSLQLLIATHSPIILSDIPKQNVLYLSCNDSDDKKAIYENQPETFGSNIFKLYNNAFFLDKGAIGAFAKSKLEDLLEEILKGNGEKEDLQKRINLIGDDFLKERFQSKFDAIYNNTQSVDDEIVRLEEKIEQ